MSRGAAALAVAPARPAPDAPQTDAPRTGAEPLSPRAPSTRPRTSDPRFVDYYGRPGAKNWEKYFEEGMKRPDAALPPELLDFFK